VVRAGISMFGSLLVRGTGMIDVLHGLIRSSPAREDLI